VGTDIQTDEEETGPTEEWKDPEWLTELFGTHNVFDERIMAALREINGDENGKQVAGREEISPKEQRGEPEAQLKAKKKAASKVEISPSQQRKELKDKLGAKLKERDELVATIRRKRTEISGLEAQLKANKKSSRWSRNIN